MIEVPRTNRLSRATLGRAVFNNSIGRPLSAGKTSSEDDPVSSQTRELSWTLTAPLYLRIPSLASHPASFHVDEMEARFVQSILLLLQQGEGGIERISSSRFPVMRSLFAQLLEAVSLGLLIGWQSLGRSVRFGLTRIWYETVKRCRNGGLSVDRTSPNKRVSELCNLRRWRMGQSVSRREFLKGSAGLAAAIQLGGGFLCASRSQQVAVTPKSPIKLFNGRDLTGLYTWLRDTGYDDPEGVFTVQDGLLRVKGRPMGYVATREAYQNYHLTVEFKWGEKTYGSETVRNSGILLHASGPDGNRNPWMASIECQLAQGCVGDFIVIRGKDEDGSEISVDITSDTVMGPDNRTRWKKGGNPTSYAGKQFWWSDHDPEFEEKIDTRGRWDVESPLGQWTRVECIADDQRLTVVVNGSVVNECYNVYPSGGKILLQSEGFEVLFRKFELYPL